MKRFYIVMTALLFLAGCGGQIQYVEVLTPGLSAATEASNMYNQLSVKENTEYGGIIFRKPSGDFGYTVYKGEKGMGTIPFSLTIPEKTTRVAFWHTHAGPGDLKKYYSPEDSRTVKKYGVPFYMSDYTGRLWILPVEHTRVSKTKGVHVGDLK